MNKTTFILASLFLTSGLFAQNQKKDSISTTKHIDFNYKTLIVPSVLIGYGVIGLESHTIKDINQSTHIEFSEHIDNRFTIDDITQYSTFLSVYGLNALGLKGKNNFRDRTTILATAYLIMGTTVNAIKYTARIERPDGSSLNSFPSGHTATTFMGAEFLYQEYKDISIWYGVSGYMIATGTGFFRMYNKRHWLTDVMTGAGIGILSTKIAYWIQPFIERTIFTRQKETKTNGMILPFYSGKEYGLSVSLSF